MTTFTCHQFALSAVASAWLLAPATSAPMNPTRAHRAKASAFCDLTASDVDNFAREGGMVQLTTQRDKVRLIVNLRVARAGGISISSKLLRFADVIDDDVP